MSGNPQRVNIRDERAADLTAIRDVVQRAFGTTVEANLVDALRQHASPILSLVAEERGAIVGHILFSPVTLSPPVDLVIMGLAPMAVVPERQRQGIGSALVHAGLARCRELGAAAVVVLGHPTYYPKFGFAPASRFDLRCEYDVPDEVFMAVELMQGGLGGARGVVRYHPAFNS